MPKTLSFKDLAEIESKAVNISDFKARPIPRFWSVEELAKGKPFSQSFIKRSIIGANIRRQQHRFARRGWTRDKRLRSEVRVPTAFYLQPEFMKRYFPEDVDEHEKAKALELLKRDFPIFVTHD